jgi:hypothetical protein
MDQPGLHGLKLDGPNTQFQLLQNGTLKVLQKVGTTPEPPALAVGGSSKV